MQRRLDNSLILISAYLGIRLLMHASGQLDSL